MTSSRASTPVGSSPSSLAFSDRAQRVIPGGGHTYSKGDDQFPANAPRAFVRGKGARIWDLDGREFVDWGMGINSVLIGHAEDRIDEAAIAALRQGQNFSRPSLLEVETAEALTALYPGLEMAKFAKNGSDANSAAVRLARAVTGRTRIAYDGSAPFIAIDDWFIGTTVMNAGVPAAVSGLAVPFYFNDLASAERAFADHPQELAAVILEPCREQRPAPGFLEGLRRLCDQAGTLLIFDEVVTGFRYGLHGVHPLFGVCPDLMSVGKGMANGYALTALVGKREYMERGGLRHADERVFLLSTTNGAEQSALAAGGAAIRFHQDHDVVGHLAVVGGQVVDGLHEAAARHGVDALVRADTDFPCRPALKFLDAQRQPSAALRTLFLQEMIGQGVFMPWVCPSYRHGAAEIEQTLEAMDAACAVYARAIDQGSVDGLLVGPATKPVFRRYN